MKITGTVKNIGQTIVVSDKFKKRALIVVTDEKYPQEIEVQFSQDKCELLNPYKEGDLVECEANLKGRAWTSPQGEVKYFLSAEGWAISGSGSARSSSSGDNMKVHHGFGPNSGVEKNGIVANFTEDAIKELEEDDDLPF